MCSYTLALGNLSEILSAITYIYFSSFVLQIGYTVLCSQENIQDFMNPVFFQRYLVLNIMVLYTIEKSNLRLSSSSE